jgi:hypothetical protein
MARKCHLQALFTRLSSPVSSSGGGLPGRPGLERVSGRSLFLGRLPFPAYSLIVAARFSVSRLPQNLDGVEILIGRDGEIHRDLGLGLDRVGPHVVRFEVPLADCGLSCARKNSGAADHVQILDDSVLADQSL